MIELVKGAKRYFLQMYIDSEHCIVGGFHPVPKEKAQRWRDLFAKEVGYVALRGYE